MKSRLIPSSVLYIFIIQFLNSNVMAQQATKAGAFSHIDTVKKISILANDCPHPSPDGSELVYTANFSGNWQVYKRDLKTNEVIRLTFHDGDDDSPVWSPDGKKILYESFIKGNREVFIMNADGSGQKNISNSSGFDVHPTWHPDGSSILFNSNRDDTSGTAIYSMKTDGSDIRRLTSPEETRTYAWWSPDAKKILFLKWLGTGEKQEREIFMMDADGSNEVNLSKSPSSTEGWPSWSPDGKEIVFSSDKTGKFQLYIMKSDGSKCTKIIDSEYEDRRPYFSKDGKKLFFDRRIPGTVVDIFVAELKK